MPNPTTNPALSPRVATVYGVAIAIAGVASLIVGWGLHVTLFTSVFDGYPALEPNSAVIFVLLGAALALRSRRFVCLALALLSSVLALATLAENVASFNGGFDDVLFAEGARMSTRTSLAFLFESAGVIMFATPARKYAAYVALAGGALGLMRLVAYVYGVDAHTGFFGATHAMSLIGAVLTVLFAQGVGVAAPSAGLTALLSAHGTTGVLAQRLLLAVTSTPIVLGFLAMKGEQAGLFDAQSGLVLFASTNVLILAGLTWWVAARLLQSELAQREREQWLSTTLGSIGDAVIATDRQARIVRMNPVAAALTGFSVAEAEGKPLADVFRIISEDTRAPVPSPAQRVLDEGVVVGLANHTLLIAKDGVERPIADSGAPIRDADGVVHGVVLVFRDQSEERRIETVLRASDLRFRRMSESGIIGIVVAEGDRVVEANETFLRMVGRTQDEVRAGAVALDHVLSREAKQTYDDALAAERAGTASASASASAHAYELELIRADATRVPTLGAAAVFDEQRSLSFFLDLTELRKAQAARRESESTVHSLEQQLRQAQKMDAIGSLAGGVAHDFNNLLSIILSYAEIIVEGLKPDDPMRKDAEEVRKAGARAAALTRQLLAFSRRQVLQPRVVELDEIIVGLMSMLKRLLPESIELTFAPRAGDCAVNVDAGQFEQVLLNLVVNARDAMPTGGKLTVSTYRVDVDARSASEHLDLAAGSYVMMSVSDNGVGMDRATQSRIFEPFFTTKDKDKGTGLGLAVVFGIVRQSGGTIWVYSEPGAGTTFKIYLPRARAQAVEAIPVLQTALEQGTETILLVEDEEQVRQLASRILTRHGYKVLAASNGGEALLLCERHTGPIDLLLTDVVMPNMSGRVLQERLATLRPAMKVLFMSGFTDDAVVQHGVLEAHVAFLQKPIMPDALLKKLREVLSS